MKLLKFVIQSEGLLLSRNKILAVPLLINILLWGYVVISYEIRSAGYKERAAVFYSSFMWILLLNLLIVGLFAVYMAGKDRETKFEQLVATYRIKNTEWLLGKWLVAQLYGLIITLITVVVQGIWFVTGAISAGEWARDIFYVFIQMEGAFIILISFGFLFAVLIKNMFAYLAVPVLLILSLTLPFDNVGTALTYQNPRLHLLTPFDYMFIGTPYESMWGIERVFSGTILHQASVIFSGIVLFLIVLVIFRRTRLTGKEKKWVPALIALFLLPAVVLGWMRFGEYDRALKRFIETGKLYAASYDENESESYSEWWNSYYDYYLDDRPYEFSMKKAHLNAELLPNHHLRVDSQLTIKNNGDTPAKDVYLTLYHGLKVEECTSPREMTFSREKDFIKLNFNEEIQPDEEVEVMLSYGGDILQYRWDAYVEHAFIDDHRIYLPKEAGWYPLIGKRPLVIAREHDERYVHFEMRNARLAEDTSTEFIVEIKNKDLNIPLVLTVPEIKDGLFHGRTQYGLSLVGGNIKEASAGEIRVIAHPEVLSGAVKLIEKYDKVWSFTENLFDVAIKPSVIYVLPEEHDYLVEESANSGFYTFSSNDIKPDSDENFAYELTQELLGEKSREQHSESFNIFYQATAWLILNELKEGPGLKEWYTTVWLTEDEYTPLIDKLDYFEKKGELNRVMKHLYDYLNGLEKGQEFNMDEALKQYEGEAGQ